MSAISFVAEFPPELLDAICAAIYNAGAPALISSLDPVVLDVPAIPTALPSSYPPGSWPEHVSRSTLLSLCLVSSAWLEAARPWLWRKVEVRLPQSWLSFVGELAPEEEDVSIAQVVKSACHAADSVLANSPSGSPTTEQLQKHLQDAFLDCVPDSSIPPDLLSLPPSREPSPRRIRAKSKSPARWKLMQSFADALQQVVQEDGTVYYVPTPPNVTPGRYVRRIDFSHFRTIGMRRLTGEAIQHRFVTSERLENVLKECPNLNAFGATEYMDGALTLPVLKELLLRGSPARGRGRLSRGRNLSGDDSDDTELERRRDCKDLVALDLTGCVSAIFYSALREFVSIYIKAEDNDSSDDERVRGEAQYFRGAREPLSFPGLQRLCLLGVKSVQPDILHTFILAFPSLTHLDVSNTRVGPELLEALAASDTVRLESLALARCVRLTGDVITNFLVQSRCTQGLKQLNLYGDLTYPSPLSEENIIDLIARAPCFTSGALEYLDLSSSPLTAAHLRSFPLQTRLRSLGLSFIPNLSLRAITDFLCSSAPNVEVLTLICTSPELAIPPSGRVFNASMALHSMLIQPLCMPPQNFAITLTPAEAAAEELKDAPTRIRVLELAMPLLNGLGAGAGTWRIVRSKGGRAWYVDTASGWVAEASSDSTPNTLIPAPASNHHFRRSLRRGHPLRVGLERLADARGNVSSGMGWHARKMEVLEGSGMLGREDGLYGAVAFAYQG